MSQEGAHMSVYESSSSLIDIAIIQFSQETIYTLDTTEAAKLADWLNAWIKTQQEQPQEVQP
jgi:cytochrome c